MKRNLVCCCLINCLALAEPASDVTVTNSAAINDSALGEVMKRFAMIKHCDPKGPSKSEMILGYANNMGIPVSNVVRVAQSITEEGLARLEDGSAINRDTQLRQCQVMLILLGATGDSSALPFLEAKSISTNNTVRQSASLSVINLMGIDSVKFLRKNATDGLNSRMDIYGMYESFGLQIQASKKKNPKANLDEAYMYLLELAEKEKAGDTAKLLDHVLCSNLEGYATSVQREQIARRFSQKGPEYCKQHFDKITGEIEKVPASKRMNFQFKNASGAPHEKTVQP